MAEYWRLLTMFLGLPYYFLDKKVSKNQVNRSELSIAFDGVDS